MRLESIAGGFEDDSGTLLTKVTCAMRDGKLKVRCRRCGHRYLPRHRLPGCDLGLNQLWCDRGDLHRRE